MRILVTGSREWVDEVAISEALTALMDGDSYDWALIHGAARGADTIARQIAVDYYDWWEIQDYPADWDKHGKAAGPIRNAQMLEEGKPDICLAFPLPGSKGTWDMIRKANAAGIEVRIIPPGEK